MQPTQRIQNFYDAVTEKQAIPTTIELCSTPVSAAC